MVMPSPGPRMPTMRSPGTAPPLGAKRTGVSESMPRSGSAPRRPSPFPGTRNTRLAALAGRTSRSRSAAPPARLALLLEVGMDRAHDVARIDLAAPDPDQDVVDRARASRGSAALSLASENFCPARSKARSMIWRPSPPNCALAASRVARRMAARARPVTTTLSQAAGGVRRSEREISTSSPFCSTEISGAMRPLILQPTAELPMSVWTA